MQTPLGKIRTILQEKNLDAILVSTPANITYLTGFDFLVDTDREGFLVITKQNHYVISSFLYKEEFLQKVPEYIFLEIGTAQNTSFWEQVNNIVKKDAIRNLGFEETNLTVAEYAVLKKQEISMTPLRIDSIRDVKNEKEITSISKACEIGDKAFSYALNKIKPGQTEKEVAFLLENYIRQQNAEASFTTIVAFGKNAAIPHHTTDQTKLQKHDVILLDFGAKVNNYCSDMSRTFFIGNVTEEQKKVYQTVLGAQEKAIKFLQDTKQPINANDVDKQSRDYITKMSYSSIPHSLGHSIGINVHDGFRLSPFSKTQLTSGMVFSVEPGIYLSGNFGVRIEDIVTLTKNVPKILTNSPKELIVL